MVEIKSVKLPQASNTCSEFYTHHQLQYLPSLFFFIVGGTVSKLHAALDSDIVDKHVFLNTRLKSMSFQESAVEKRQ